MSMKAQILFLFSIYCFLIGSTPVMKAQTGKFYSTDKELSNSLINAVYQDRKGFIWIATYPVCQFGFDMEGGGIAVLF